jgi:multiple sugar transport system permease protein
MARDCRCARWSGSRRLADAIRRSGQRPGSRAEAIAAWLLALPAFLLMWAMLLGPAVAVLLLSFTDWTMGDPEVPWHGLGNYAELWGDRVFWTSLRNTLVYVGVTLPATVGLGLLAAILVEGAARGRGFYRAAFFLPVASTLLGWRWCGNSCCIRASAS